VAQAMDSTPSSRHSKKVSSVQTMCCTEMAPWHYTAADRGCRIDEALSMAERCMLIAVMAIPRSHIAPVDRLVFWKLMVASGVKPMSSVLCSGGQSSQERFGDEASSFQQTLHIIVEEHRKAVRFGCPAAHVSS